MTSPLTWVPAVKILEVYHASLTISKRFQELDAREVPLYVIQAVGPQRLAVRRLNDDHAVPPSYRKSAWLSREISRSSSAIVDLHCHSDDSSSMLRTLPRATSLRCPASTSASRAWASRSSSSRESTCSRRVLNIPISMSRLAAASCRALARHSVSTDLFPRNH